MVEQYLFHGLDVDLDAGRRGLQRRRPDIEKAGGRGSNKNDLAVHQRGVEVGAENLPGRYAALRYIAGEVQPHPALGAGRQFVIADLYIVQAQLDAAIADFAACTGRFDDIRPRTLNDAQHLGGK